MARAKRKAGTKDAEALLRDGKPIDAAVRRAVAKAVSRPSKARRSSAEGPPIPWDRPQEEWAFPLWIPANPYKTLRGRGVATRGSILSTVSERSIRQNRYILKPFDLRDEQEVWCTSTDRLLCAWEDGRFVALDHATEAEERELRAPRFVQSDRWPLCCGRSMQFVGQLDENSIAAERPPGAKLWWHDAGSFYIFTCAVCLECKSFGLQY